MPVVDAGTRRICYEQVGQDTDEAVILIMGLGGQLTMWPEGLCPQLADSGYRVIRLDNRDVGLSAWYPEKGAPDMEAIAAALFDGRTGQAAGLPYTLSDMADDVIALMDLLRIDRAHICGASMGGMIAQLLALDHPDRVASLTSVMSHSGSPQVPPPTDAAAAAFGMTPQGTDEASIVEHGLALWRVIGSPGFPTPEADLRAALLRDYRRGVNPEGVQRQVAAMMGASDRTERLGRLRIPVVVVHGAEDPVIPPIGGQLTASAISGADLRIVEGMGHDCPDALIGVLADAITSAARRAQAQA